jgi:hypothetical protein
MEVIWFRPWFEAWIIPFASIIFYRSDREVGQQKSTRLRKFRHMKFSCAASND